MRFLILILSFRLVTEMVIGADEKATLHLLTMLSYSRPLRDVPRQERGVEILPAAHLAINEINRLPNFLPGYFLQLTEIMTEGCNTELALVGAIKHLSDKRELTVGIIGLFCNEITKLISQLATQYHGLDLVQLSGSTDPVLQDNNSRYPHLYRMLPSSIAYIESVVHIMEKLEWSRIGILYAGSHDTFYFSTAQKFAQSSSNDIEVSFYGEVPSTEPPDFPILQDLRHSGTKITMLLLPFSIASELICTAYTNGLRWPNYAWLLLEKDAQDWSASTKCNDGTMGEAGEGVFLLRYQLQPSDQNSKLISGITYNEYLQNLYEISGMNHSNPYANVLYDSVWTIALALNKSMFQEDFRNCSGKVECIREAIKNELPNVSFAGSLGNIYFDSNQEVKTQINIFQFRNGTSVRIGYYDPVCKCLNLDRESVGEIPSDELERVYQIFATPLTIIMSAGVVLCILFTTSMSVLFICYRNQPEVKASSCYLSVFMFLGSYSLLIGLLIHILSSRLVVVGTGRKAICSMITGFSSVGFDIVLATLFTKMLRIYRVFTYFGRTGKAWSDRVLIMIILLVALGKITVFIIWALVDIYYLQDTETYSLDTTPPHYKVAQYCYSEHTGVWVTVLFAYSGVLFLLLLLLAFKTRKIRRENFKDTKKVNALILTLVVNTCLVIPLWWVQRTVGDPIGSYVIVAIGYGVTGTAGQIYLTAPKVLPPFYRHLQSKYYHYVTKMTSLEESSDSNEIVIKRQTTAMSLVI